MKKSFFLAGLLLLPFTPSAANNVEMPAHQATIELIQQAKRAIITEQKEAALLIKETKQHITTQYVGHLMDFLAHKKEKAKIIAMLEPIITSDDFFITIDFVTDFQVAAIIDRQIKYTDIIYDEIAYPAEQNALIQSLDKAIADTFPTLSKITNTLIDIYYLQATQKIGYKLLLAKLDAREQQLLGEC